MSNLQGALKDLLEACEGSAVALGSIQRSANPDTFRTNIDVLGSVRDQVQSRLRLTEGQKQELRTLLTKKYQSQKAAGTLNSPDAHGCSLLHFLALFGPEFYTLVDSADATTDATGNEGLGAWNKTI